ncbi:mucin-2-like [Patiria miniata]|uniref:Ig-like domain-containing protein n=1 Tax=Patiria miniata TaxID=46514 RepID=A0A914BP93_PATMI|nr:mucin-2-like [Patiria miniata]
MEFVTLRSFGLIFCVLTLCFYGAFGVLEAQIVVVNGTEVGPGVVDAEEGDNITLRCEVRGLAQGDTITWRLNFQVLTTDGRIVITQGPLDGRGDSSTDEALTLTISHVSTRDTGRYVCEVRQQNAENPLTHAEEATLTVFSFPGDGNPACTPSGPLAVYIGDSTALTCASRRGNPPVNLTIFTLDSAPSDVAWNTTESEDTITKSKDLVINAPHADFVFICKITSPRYPDERRNCTIGPIRVEQRPQPTTPQPTFSHTPTVSETTATSELTRVRSSAADVSTAQPLPDTSGYTILFSSPGQTDTAEPLSTQTAPLDSSTQTMSTYINAIPTTPSETSQTASSASSDTPSTEPTHQQTSPPVTENPIIPASTSAMLTDGASTRDSTTIKPTDPMSQTTSAMSEVSTTAVSLTTTSVSSNTPSTEPTFQQTSQPVTENSFTPAVTSATLTDSASTSDSTTTKPTDPIMSQTTSSMSDLSTATPEVSTTAVSPTTTSVSSNTHSTEPTFQLTTQRVTENSLTPAVTNSASLTDSASMSDSTTTKPTDQMSQTMSAMSDLSTATPEVSTTAVSPTTTSVSSNTPSTEPTFQQTAKPVTESCLTPAVTNSATLTDSASTSDSTTTKPTIPMSQTPSVMSGLSTFTPDGSTSVVSPTTSSLFSDTPSTEPIFQQTTLLVTGKLITTIATLTNPTSQISDPTTELLSTMPSLSTTDPDSSTTVESTPTALPSTTGTFLTEPKTNPTTSPSDSPSTFPDHTTVSSDHSTVFLEASTIQSSTEKGEVSTNNAPPTQLPLPTETSPTSQSSDPITSPLTSLSSATTVTPELSSQDPIPTAINPRTHRSSTTGKYIPSKTESPRPKSSHKPAFTTLDHMPPDPMEGDQQPPLYWLIAFIVVAALLILSVVIIVLMCLKMWHMSRFNWTLGTDALPTREQHERQRGQMKNGIVNGGFYEIPLSPV